jgi:hypothetical protein
MIKQMENQQPMDTNVCFLVTQAMVAPEAECYLQISWLDGVTEVREKADTGADADGGLAACNNTHSVSVQEGTMGSGSAISL